jgi:hypothetical protein
MTGQRTFFTAVELENAALGEGDESMLLIDVYRGDGSELTT